MIKVPILIKHLLFRFIWKMATFYVMKIKKIKHPVSDIQIIDLKDNYKLYIIPTLWDNYSYLLTKDKKAVLIDPSDFIVISKILKAYSLNLRYILVTHDHIDHIMDILKFSRVYKADICAFRKSEIPGKYIEVNNESIISFYNIHLEIMHCPGHTKSNCVWYSKELELLFTGDTLFYCGYGGILDDPKDMFQSLQKIKQLPENINLFFGHEYALFNIKFSLEVEPNNQLLHAKYAIIKDNLQKKIPSVPSSLAMQKKLNLVLRCDEYNKFENIQQLKKKYNKEQ